MARTLPAALAAVATILVAGCQSAPRVRYHEFEIWQIDKWDSSPFREECVEILNERPADTLEDAIAPSRLEDICALLWIGSRPQITWGKFEEHEDMGPFYVAVTTVAKDERISSQDLLAALAHEDIRMRGAAHLALLARYRVPVEFSYEYSPDDLMAAEQVRFWADMVRRTAPADELSPRYDVWGTIQMADPNS